MKNFQLRIAIIAAVTLLGVTLLVPSLLWYTKPQEARQELERLKRIPKWLVRLGLDLRGGTHLLLELDSEKLAQQADQQLTVKDAIDRAVEIIRNRVDEFGVSEPFIAKQGERFIVVQLPGISDPRRAKDLIGKTALLEFVIVDDSADASTALSKIRELGEPWDAAGKIKPEAAKLLPKDRRLLKSRTGEDFFIVRSQAELTGAYLVNARVEFGDYSLPVVSLVFNGEGGRLFARATEANVNKNMAIVLDGVVQSAPVIRERIPGGRAVIEGQFTMEDARDLALVLRAGALPAPVRVVEERTIGPSLGEDSIRKGLMAAGLGSVFIFIFMLVYYRGSGLLANLCLLLNGILIFSGLAAFNATLTLPGLAGFALTLAMSVDASVLIFERIREELTVGKSVRVALEAGFERALSSIVDSNLTALIAAFFLFQFGSGPVKGFAVTLSLGVIISMFTALFVNKTLFMLYYEIKRDAKTVSI